MYQRVNDKHNQNKNPDPEIREEQKAEFGGIGNEAIGNLIEDDTDNMLSHYLSNDLNLKNSGGKKEKGSGIIGNIMNDDKNIMNESDEKNIMNENDDSRIDDEPLDHYAANDLNRKDKKKKKDKEPEKKVAENIIEDLKEISTASVKGGAEEKNGAQNDLQEVEKDNAPIENWDFAAQKLDPKKSRAS